MGSHSYRWTRVLCLLGCLLPAVAGWALSASRARSVLYPDFATNLRVQYIGQRLALADALPNVSFFVFRSKKLYAQSLPGSRVYLTSAMATSFTDDELAFMLGRELTHVKELQAKHQWEHTQMATVLGALLIGVWGAGNDAINLGSNVIGGLASGHYSRRDEYRADAGALRLMAQCGYDPRRAADALQRVLERTGRGNAHKPVLGWFAAHPDIVNRQQRLRAAAAELEQTPPPLLPPPLGVAVALDPSAEHANAWVQSYLALVVLRFGAGRAVVLAGYPIPRVLTAAAPAPELLPSVTFITPPVAAAYDLTLALHQVPAGGAPTIAQGRGTAVEARLHWTQLASGVSGDCVAIDQTVDRVDWQARQQLKNPEQVNELSTGKSLNVEGTLEATAVRRATRAFDEVLAANGPVDHRAPVTLPMKPDHLRAGDYVDVTRDNTVVAEVRVDYIAAHQISGTVLWGVQRWEKHDQFVRASR